MRTICRIGVLALALALPYRPASAGPTCIVPQWGGSTGNRQLVDVWLNNTTSNGVAQVLQLDQGAVEDALLRALSIWNEESGAAIVLRYRGTTIASGVTGAITFRANPGCAQVNGVPAETFPYQSGGVMSRAEIVFHKKWYMGSGLCWFFGDIEWQIPDETSNATDFVGVLIHEMGHAMGFLHPGQLQCDNLGQTTVMDSSLSNGSRILRLWDKHRLARRYTRRSDYALLTRRTWSPTSGVWGTMLTGGSGRLHRAGSLSQNYSWTLQVMYGLGWYHAQRGFLKEIFRTSDSAFIYPGVLPTSPSIRHADEGPAAVAIDPNTGRAIVVYPTQASTLPWYFSGTPPGDLHYICYRLSYDAGINWGSQTCLTSGTKRYGLSVAYDPRSAKFVIGYTQYVGGNQFDYQVSLITMPTTGGSWVLTMLPNTSWHAPSIACRNASMGCRIAYEDKVTGGLRWIEAEVDLTTGQIAAGATRSGSWALYDSPSIVWFEHDQTYRLAFRQGAGAIYARAMTSIGTSWLGMPDIYNSSTGRVSSPMLATERACTPGCTGNLRAWFLQWW